MSINKLLIYCMAIYAIIMISFIGTVINLKNEAKNEIKDKDLQIQELQSRVILQQIEKNKVEEILKNEISSLNKLKSKRYLTENDIQSLEKIVEAEASTEGVRGKTLVASVVLNRWNLAKDKTVHQIITQRGQFSPVANGTYYRAVPSEETKQAVEMSLFKDYSNGSLYFMNPEISSRSNVRWFRNNLELRLEHKNHLFFK